MSNEIMVPEEKTGIWRIVVFAIFFTMVGFIVGAFYMDTIAGNKEERCMDAIESGVERSDLVLSCGGTEPVE